MCYLSVYRSLFPTELLRSFRVIVGLESALSPMLHEDSTSTLINRIDMKETTRTI
mgnify:FL=1